MSPPGRGFLDAAYQVLKEAGHPMHGRDIVQACLDRDLWATDALDPNISGTTTLYSEIKRRPNQRGFAMFGKGLFGLKEWDETHAGAGPTPVSEPNVDARPGSGSLAPLTPTTDRLSSTPDSAVSLRVAGRRIRLTRRETLERARRAIANDLPAEAGNYVSWIVEIDGQIVGLKWLFGVLTGMPHGAFQPNQARRALENLGLSVRRIETKADPEVDSQSRSKHQRAHHSSESTLRGPVAILDREIAAIRNFLNGRSARPSDERLCDWVNFCYEFELFREGRDLFRLVDPSQVNTWYYERTRRLAKVCAMKVTGQA